MKFTAVLLMFLLLPGCVLYYKTGDMRNSFNEADRKIGEAITKLEKFHTDAADGYSFLMKTVNDTTATPYPALKKYLGAMDATLDHLKTYPPQIAEIRKDFDAVAKDKGKIESNKPEWDQAKPIRDRFSDLVDAAKKDFETVKETGDDFTELSLKNGVGQMPASELKSKMAEYLAEIAKSPADSARYPEVKAGVDEILALVGDRTMVWIGPGSRVKAKYDALASPKK